jgi:hypothetical protein
MCRAQRRVARALSAMVPGYRITPDRPSLELGTQPFLTVPSRRPAPLSKPRIHSISNIPKPMVTKLIQSLEAHFGVKLRRRTTRRVTVTPEGALYHGHATRLITELEEMDQLVAGVRAQPKGLLRIDIGSSLANIILGATRTKLMSFLSEGREFRCRMSDGGWPPEVGVQTQISNCPGAAMVQKAMVVSNSGKRRSRRASGECREGERK